MKIEIGYKVSYKTEVDTHSGWYKDGIRTLEEAIEYASCLKNQNCRDIVISKYKIVTYKQEEEILSL